MSNVITVVVDVCLGQRHGALSKAEMEVISDNVHDALMEHLQPEAGEVAWVTAEATAQYLNPPKETT